MSTAYISLVRSTLEYGATIWDPYQENNIYKLEKIQRKAARFITNDYRTRESGSVTKMLSELNILTLQNRRKDKRLAFLYSIQKGSVPAIDPKNYLTPVKSKRKIKAKTFSDYNCQNIIKRHQILHDKCFQLPSSKSTTYRHSFFPKTISEWNELSDSVVSSDNIDIFKSRLQISKSRSD